MLIPHFVGAGTPYWNPHAKGIIFGLSLGHHRGDLIRAIFEGVSLEIRKSIEVVKELGIPLKDVRVAGGMTRNPIFNQIQADVYGLPVLRGEATESTALGCAILAGVGAGVFKNINEAIGKTVRVAEKYEPTAENQEKYDKLFELHQKIYEVLEKSRIYRDFSALQF
jgi:xylulokinase